MNNFTITYSSCILPQKQFCVIKRIPNTHNRNIDIYNNAKIIVSDNEYTNKYGIIQQGKYEGLLYLKYLIGIELPDGNIIPCKHICHDKLLIIDNSNMYTSYIELPTFKTLPINQKDEQYVLRTYKDIIYCS